MNAAVPPKVGEREWQKEYEERVKAALEVDPLASVSLKASVFLELVACVEEFVFFSRRYGCLIIDEISLPVAKQSIQPVSLGG